MGSLKLFFLITTSKTNDKKKWISVLIKVQKKYSMKPVWNIMVLQEYFA